MPKNGLYLAIGDSTVYNTVNIGEGMFLYPQAIVKLIRDNYGPVQLANLAMSSSMSRDGVRNLNIIGGNLNPDLLTIGYGMNDAIFNTSGLPITEFKTNITKIVGHFRSQNPNVHIILCTPSTVSATADRTEGQLAPYRTALAELATSLNVSICRFETAWTQAQASTNTTDGLHPNKAGHIAKTNVLWTIVRTGSWLQLLR